MLEPAAMSDDMRGGKPAYAPSRGITSIPMPMEQTTAGTVMIPVEAAIASNLSEVVSS